MKIFIFGSNGMLGNYIKSYLSKNYQIVALTRQDYDLSNLEINSLTELLLKNQLEKNDIVVNCAGVIPQTGNIDPRLYFKINSIFPIVLSMICFQHKCKMIHITTDCVFSGKTGNYFENSEPDEINDYGISKSLGELCNATIIRTSIIGEEINNKRSLLEWVKSNSEKEVNGYTNHYWNGVTCLQLSKIVNNIIKNDLYWKGVRHIFSPRSVTKFELITMINEIYNLNMIINKFETKTEVDKTLNSIYPQLLKIPDLSVQINQMKNYSLNYQCKNNSKIVNK